MSNPTTTKAPQAQELSESTLDEVTGGYVVKLENVQITSYQIGVLDKNPSGSAAGGHAKVFDGTTGG